MIAHGMAFPDKVVYELQCGALCVAAHSQQVLALQRRLKDQLSRLASAAATPGSICHQDIVLVFELEFAVEVRATKQQHFEALVAAAGRQAHIQPQQQFAILDVLSSDGGLRDYAGMLLRHCRQRFEEPFWIPVSPLSQAHVGRISLSSEDATSAFLVNNEDFCQGTSQSARCSGTLLSHGLTFTRSSALTKKL